MKNSDYQFARKYIEMIDELQRMYDDYLELIIFYENNINSEITDYFDRLIDCIYRQYNELIRDNFDNKAIKKALHETLEKTRGKHGFNSTKFLENLLQYEREKWMK